MNLFNKAMARLSSTNDSFLNLLAQNENLKDDVIALKGLLYTQTDIGTINQKINNLEKLLRLYSTNQIISNDSIEVEEIAGTPPSIALNNITTKYSKIEVIKTMDMFNQEGIIPMNVHVPKNRDFMLHIINNDQISIDLENDDHLTIILDRELDMNQTMEIMISGDPKASENKKLDIYMSGDEEEFLLVGNIDLPVFYNDENQTQNSAYLWEDFRFDIAIDDQDKIIQLTDKDKLMFQFNEFPQLVSDSINKGDVLAMNNLFISINGTIYDFSGQYKVDKVDLTGSVLDPCEITLDISSNKQFVETIKEDSNDSYPYDIHNEANNIYLLRNKPYISLNKGYKINVIKQLSTEELKDRYLIKKERL